MQHHKYSYSDLESMLPWEREVYMSLLVQWIKEENEKKYKLLLQEHSNLKSKFERIKTKLENQSKLDEKIDELNQETEGLIGEIEKW